MCLDYSHVYNIWIEYKFYRQTHTVLVIKLLKRNVYFCDIIENVREKKELKLDFMTLIYDFSFFAYIYEMFQC